MKKASSSLAVCILGFFLVGCGSSGPKRVVVTEGATTITANTCTKFTLELQGSDGTPVAAPEPNGYTFLLFPMTRYADAACAGATSTGNLTFPSGASSVTFYVSESAGNVSYESEALLTNPTDITSLQRIDRFVFSVTVAR